MSLDGRHEFLFARLVETTLINLYVATFQERIKLFFPSSMQHRNGKPTILKACIKKGRFHCCDRQRGLSFKSMKTPSFRQTYQQRIMIFIPETWEKMNQPIRGENTTPLLRLEWGIDLEYLASLQWLLRVLSCLTHGLDSGVMTLPMVGLVCSLVF